MRWLVVSILMAASLVQSAQAQDAAPTAPPEPVTYFLIDASGSMNTADTAELAESEIRRQLDALRQEKPDALVSRTYFRAANRDLCSHPIKINAPVPASSSIRELVVSGNNDYTPLGNALASAVQQIGDESADIFIVTDGYQSADCGLDFCAAARDLLPRPNLRVQVLSVGKDETGLQLSRCVEEAQAEGTRGEPETEPAVQTEDLAAGDDGSSNSKPKSVSDWTKDFIRQWYWAIGVMLALASAASLGIRESERALILEQGKEKARSLQDLMRDGDQTAEVSLTQLISEIEQNPKLSQSNDMLWKRLWKLVLRYPVGLLGVLMLVMLATLPREFLTVRLGGTKDAAWSVLNSDFATAFALALISVVFFAGTQNQRKREAKHGFDIETEAAKRIAKRERSEALERAYAQYTERYDIVRFSRFDELDQLGSGELFSEVSPETVQKSAQTVAERLRAEALGKRLDVTDGEEALSRESVRLKNLVRSVSQFFSNPPDLKAFIARMQSSSRLQEHGQQWEDLRNALSLRDAKRIEAAVLRLSEVLGSAGAK